MSSWIYGQPVLANVEAVNEAWRDVAGEPRPTLALWETLITRGLLPDDWLEGPREFDCHHCGMAGYGVVYPSSDRAIRPEVYESCPNCGPLPPVRVTELRFPDGFSHDPRLGTGHLAYPVCSTDARILAASHEAAARAESLALTACELLRPKVPFDHPRKARWICRSLHSHKQKTLTRYQRLRRSSIREEPLWLVWQDFCDAERPHLGMMPGPSPASPRQYARAVEAMREVLTTGFTLERVTEFGPVLVCLHDPPPGS